jgi:multiple sugar transport system permease protein
MTRVVQGVATSAAAPLLPREGRWRRRELLIGFVFLVPAILYLLAFSLYPIIYNLLMSVKLMTFKSFVTGNTPFIGLGNFERLVANPDFGTALRNTVVFTTGSLFFQFTIGLAIAIFFQRKFPLSGFLRALILMPWLTPVLASGAVWVQLFDMDYGVVNFVLRTLHLTSQPIPWLTSAQLAFVSVLIANIWLGIPFNMVILYGGLEAIPRDLYESAAIDGAGPWQLFRSITWPLLRPVSTVVLLLGLIYTLKVFDLIMAITQGGPANTSQTLNTLAYSLSFITFDFGLGAAAGDILLVVVVFFGLLYLWYIYHEASEVGR